MSKNADSENEEISLEGEKDVTALLKKIQLKLDSMEEKIDSLVRQSKQKNFQDKLASKPRREYGASRYQKDRKYEGKKEEVSSEGKFYHGRPFGKKNVSGKSSLKKGKKPFNKSSK